MTEQFEKLKQLKEFLETQPKAMVSQIVVSKNATPGQPMEMDFSHNAFNPEKQRKLLTVLIHPEDFNKLKETFVKNNLLLKSSGRGHADFLFGIPVIFDDRVVDLL